VDLAQAASDLERGNITNDTTTMTRKQAVQLRRQLDETSGIYKPGRIVPTEASAQMGKAAKAMGDAMRTEINETPLGPLNASEHANLMANKAVQDAASGFTAELRGQRYATTRGVAQAARSAIGGIIGTTAGGPLSGAALAAALPLAYKFVTSTPLKMLTANTRLAIAHAIVRGDIKLANQLASDALMVARLPSLQESQADSTDARKMSAIE